MFGMRETRTSELAKLCVNPVHEQITLSIAEKFQLEVVVDAGIPNDVAYFIPYEEYEKIKKAMVNESNKFFNSEAFKRFLDSYA